MTVNAPDYDSDQFFELSLDLLCIAGTDGYFKRVNRAWEEALGFSREELCRKPYIEFVHPDDRARTQEAAAQVSSAPVTAFENRYLCRDGSYKWLAWNSTALGPDRPLVYCVARDVTERKRMEEALRLSEVRFQTIIETAGAGIKVRDLRGRLTDCNALWAEMIGYTKDELLGMALADYTDPDDLPTEEALLQELVTGQRDAYHLEKRYRHKTGHVWWGHTSVSLVRDGKGQPQFTVAVIKDLTTQKKAEHTLRQFSERLEQRVAERTQELRVANHALQTLETWQRALIDAIQGIVWECNAQSWLFTFVSPQAESILGYPVSHWLDQPEFWQRHTHPDDREWVPAYCATMAREQTKYAFEYRMIAADGRVVWLRDIVTVEKEGTEPRILRGIMVDITEARRAKAALAKSEQQFRLLAEHAVDVIFHLHQSGQILYVSPASAKMLGYLPEEMLGTHFSDYVSVADLPQAVEAFSRALAGSSVASLELCITAKDRTQVAVEVTMGPFYEHDTIMGVHGIVRDIRERKRAEEELRRSSTFIDSVVENLPMMVFVKDAVDLRFVRINKAGEELLGYDRQDLLGRTDYDFFPTAEADFFTQADRAVLRSGRLLDIPEEPIQTKRKGVRFLHTKKIPIFDGSGVPQYLLGISEDITERKQAEEALRESEERLRQAVRVGHIGIFDHDHLTDVIYWSPETRHMFAWEADEPPNLMNCLEQVHPEDRERITQAIRRAHDPDGDGLFDAEYRIYDCHGTLHWLSTRSRTFFTGEGRARHKVRTIGAIADVTERKRTEQALRRTEAQLRKAMDERQALVEDLHDNIIQTIYASGLILEECRELLHEDPVQADKRLEQTMNHLNKVIADVRHHLVSADREELSGAQLCTKLTELVTHLEGVRGVRFMLDLAPATAERLTPAQAFHTLCIVQEAVSNSLRHSHSHMGRISLQKLGERICVEVRDDGVGFTAEDAGRKGHGLQNMAMRAQKLGGTFRVVSHPGRGTQILVEFPEEVHDVSRHH